MLHKIILKRGTGIPLVFLHGFLGRALDWEDVCSHLKDCVCIAFDLPGHGDSAWNPNIFFPFPKFHLIGYSMGGRIAMRYALEHSDQIASLTLLSTHPGLLNEKSKAARLRSDILWAQKLLTQPIDHFLTEWYSQPLFEFFKPNFVIRKKQNIGGLIQALLHYSLGKQPFLNFSKALHLIGEYDTNYHCLHPQKIIIPKAGHVLHLEQPKYIASIIQKRTSTHELD